MPSGELKIVIVAALMAGATLPIGGALKFGITILALYCQAFRKFYRFQRFFLSFLCTLFSSLLTVPVSLKGRNLFQACFLSLTLWPASALSGGRNNKK